MSETPITPDDPDIPDEPPPAEATETTSRSASPPTRRGRRPLRLREPPARLAADDRRATRRLARAHTCRHVTRGAEAPHVPRASMLQRLRVDAERLVGGVEADQALQPVALVHHRDPRHPFAIRRSPARARPGRRAPRAACRRARAARSARRPRPGTSSGVSVPRKRSPSVTSSSFLRGLTNTSRASASGVAGPTVSRAAHHHVADGRPRLVDRDVDGVGHDALQSGARFSRNAATPSRPFGPPARSAIVRASSASCSWRSRVHDVAQQPLDAAVRRGRARPRAARASVSASASSASSATTRFTSPSSRAASGSSRSFKQHQLRRAARADQPRQRPARAAVGREPDRRVGHREPRRLGREHDVAGDRQAHPAARRRAAHGADHRRVERGERLDPGVELRRQPQHRVAHLVAHLAHPAQVAADAERLARRR